MMYDGDNYWVPEDGFAEETTLAELKTLRKLELLEVIFDGLGDRIVGEMVSIKNNDVEALVKVKNIIDSATTIEELTSVEIKHVL